MLLPTIKEECSQFLEVSNNLPLLKNLPSNTDGFRKVKVRTKNKNELFIEAFNASFPNDTKIFQRSVFANGEISFVPSVESTLEPFYIFPIDGFKFIYNPVVTNAFNDYKIAVTNLTNVIPCRETAIDMFSKVIKQSYVGENLRNGISIGAEIIIYNIPYYYAIRKSLVDDYNKLS